MTRLAIIALMSLALSAVLCYSTLRLAEAIAQTLVKQEAISETN